MTSTEEKAAARTRARTALKQIETGGLAQELSAMATRSFCSLAEYANAEIVLAFLSMPGEIDTGTLIQNSVERGLKIAVPRIEGQDIAFVPLDLNFRSWPRDRLGIPAPPPSQPALTFEELGRSKVLVAAPGLAFDQAGGRLGRGKGFYDRFLAKARRATASGGGTLTVCGFCYSVQLVDSIPSDERDMRVDSIATELGIVPIPPA